MLRRAFLATLPFVALQARAATRQKVVATFSILGDFVREVGGHRQHRA